MLAFLLGVERLRTLDRAVGGGLYAAMGRCKELGLEPHVCSTEVKQGEAKAYELVFLARDADGQSVFHEMWRVPEAAEDARTIAIEISLRDTIDGVRAGVARIMAGLDAMDRGEEPGPLIEPDPKAS